jgi:GntR family transcriptional regulator, transcriptional repressor for pyruvate dehydrogenase complex
MAIGRFKRVKSTKTYAEIADQIVNLIKSGELQPGERLPAERNLAQEFGTGRQCLREALSVLEVLGVIEVKLGRGTFIRDDVLQDKPKLALNLMETVNPFEIIETRKIMEVKIAGLAARRATVEEITELEHLAGKVEQVEHNEPSEENLHLHLAFARASHNTVLMKIMSELIEEMRKQLWRSLKGKSLRRPGRRSQYHAEHRAIIEAIKARDARKAEKLMQTHLGGLEYDLRHD